MASTTTDTTTTAPAAPAAPVVTPVVEPEVEATVTVVAPRCVAVSPDNLNFCELDEGHEGPHQVTIFTANGPQILYWF
jgi:hypothetical protein